MDETSSHSMSALPWATDLRSLTAEAATCDDAAACLFVIEPTIPAAARPGYAALVVAHTRDGEPVTIFDDGTALLLVKKGGIVAARIAAERIVGQLRKLGLDFTLRAAVVAVDAQPQTLATRARALAEKGKPGTVISK